jgi:hypothetical protein
MGKQELYDNMNAAYKIWENQNTVYTSIQGLNTNLSTAITNINSAINNYNNAYELFTTKGYIGGLESKATKYKEDLLRTKEKLQTLKEELDSKYLETTTAEATQKNVRDTAWQTYLDAKDRFTNYKEPAPTPTPTSSSTPSGSTSSGGTGENAPPSGRGGTPGHYKPAAIQDDKLNYLK